LKFGFYPREGRCAVSGLRALLRHVPFVRLVGFADHNRLLAFAGLHLIEGASYLPAMSAFSTAPSTASSVLTAFFAVCAASGEVFAGAGAKVLVKPVE